MSQENAEIVRRAFDEWNRRDFDSLRDLFHEDVELHFIGGFSNLLGEALRGRDAVFQFWRDFIGTLGGEFELEAAHDAGSRVVTIATVRGVGGTSGVPSEIRFGQVWSLRDGKGEPDGQLLRCERSTRSRRATGVGGATLSGAGFRPPPAKNAVLQQARYCAGDVAGEGTASEPVASAGPTTPWTRPHPAYRVATSHPASGGAMRETLTERQV
jgi:ketosteroid isomerase-like protein